MYGLVWGEQPLTDPWDRGSAASGERKVLGRVSSLLGAPESGFWRVHRAQAVLRDVWDVRTTTKVHPLSAVPKGAALVFFGVVYVTIV
jgi:hypothetical protein